MGKPRKSASPGSIPEDEVYTMEALLSYKKENGRDYYLVKWKGYSDGDATWEPRANILCPGPELLQQMHTLKQPVVPPVVKKRKEMTPPSSDNEDEAMQPQPKKREGRNGEATGVPGATARQRAPIFKPCISKISVQDGQYCVSVRKSADETESVSMDVARNFYPQELLDFLLERVKFLPFSKANDGDTPTSAKLSKEVEVKRKTAKNQSVSESR
eukprot:Selendium_serpulae@DN5693_c0_g1_i1.p1